MFKRPRIERCYVTKAKKGIWQISNQGILKLGRKILMKRMETWIIKGMGLLKEYFAPKIRKHILSWNRYFRGENEVYL